MPVPDERHKPLLGAADRLLFDLWALSIMVSALLFPSVVSPVYVPYAVSLLAAATLYLVVRVSNALERRARDRERGEPRRRVPKMEPRYKPKKILDWSTLPPKEVVPPEEPALPKTGKILKWREVPERKKFPP